MTAIYFFLSDARELT